MAMIKSQMEEIEFNELLNLAREEVEIATESFYTYIEIHNQLSSNDSLYRILNRNPSFWNIILHALQNTFIITLGRIFDDLPSSHSIHKVINNCLAHLELFSKAALAKRKMKNGNKPDWLDKYLSNAFEPSVDDLRVFKKELSKHRKVFDPVYKDIRNKVVAHTEFKDSRQISDLFSGTQIGEIEKILYGLHDILDAIWELMQNGKEPTLGSKTYDYKDRISNTTRNVLNSFQMS